MGVCCAQRVVFWSSRDVSPGNDPLFLTDHVEKPEANQQSMLV